MEKLIENSGLIEYGDRIVIGVSGGPDSICLLHILSSLREKLNLTLFVVHINHSLRDEADFEEEYVKKVANSLNIKFFSKKVDISKLAVQEKKSTEEVARNIRYNFFNEIANSVNANKIAVAHNANDNAETVLLNLIRGSGLEGLCGISEKNGKIIRPLLSVSREKIENYIKKNELEVMTDKTNFEEVYTRNKIRNGLIPKLKEINPEIVESINRTSQILKSKREIIDENVREKYSVVRKKCAEVVLKKDEFLLLNIAMKREILRRAILEYRGNLTDIGFKNLDNAIEIIATAQSGSKVELSCDLKIEISYNDLKFFTEKECVSFNYELNIPGTTYIKEIDKKIIARIVDANEVSFENKDRNRAFFDIAKTGKKLYVRSKEDGDFFYPTGIDGKKTLKKFFSDIKLDLNKRDKIPLLTTDKEIVWIVGHRSSKKFLKDTHTKEVIIFDYGENI